MHGLPPTLYILTVILVTSAPALSSRGTTKASTSPSMDDVSSRSSWKNYANEDLSRNINIDDDSSFGVATPFLKSFMQVKLLSFYTFVLWDAFLSLRLHIYGITCWPFQFGVALMSTQMKNVPKPESYSLGVVTGVRTLGTSGLSRVIFHPFQSPMYPLCMHDASGNTF